MQNHLQQITYKGVQINILSLAILQPEIQGNKYFKLKYNLQQAKELKLETLLTFGGEYSNHIHATAIAGKQKGFQTIGLIRGDELETPTSTLQDAINNGMQILYLNRTDFRIARKLVNENELDAFKEILLKNNIEIDLAKTFIIPEGGTNALALKGTAEILDFAKTIDYKTVCCAIGTAGTIAGIISSIDKDKTVLGFPALKGNFFEKDIHRLLNDTNQTIYTNWKLTHDYHFKGFGAFNEDLILFINQFYKDYNIPLCTLYTGKMFYGIFDMIDKGLLTNEDKVLAIHTGGLQGRKAFNEKNGDLLNL
jgi:1-aminocyclopropane-1-carboxylate deaminase